MATTETENFYRVITLLIDAGTEAMRKLFTSYALSSGATTVYSYLCNEQAKIFNLQKSKHLKGHQVSLLLGYGGSSSGIDINTWDITLLCVLLKVRQSLLLAGQHVECFLNGPACQVVFLAVEQTTNVQTNMYQILSCQFVNVFYFYPVARRMYVMTRAVCILR